MIKNILKRMLIVASLTLLFFSSSLIIEQSEAEASMANVCKWATRETSSGWEAICISSGVGYVCSCGDVKPY